MLQGSFETFDFGEVVDMLAGKGQTGKLRLHSGTASVDLYLAAGRLTHGEVVEHGATAHIADDRARLEEACFEVLRWEHGTFEFHPGVAAPSHQLLDIVPGEVLEGARNRLEGWRRVEEVIPSLDVQPQVAEELPEDEVTIDRLTWRALRSIDGRRSVNTLSRLLSLSTYETCWLLADMAEEGLIEINTGRTPRTSIAAAATGKAPRPAGRTVRLPQRPEGVAASPAEMQRPKRITITGPEAEPAEAEPGGTAAGNTEPAGGAQPSAGTTQPSAGGTQPSAGDTEPSGAKRSEPEEGATASEPEEGGRRGLFRSRHRVTHGNS